MKKMLIAGNWKMNLNSYDSGKLAESIVSGTLGRKLNVAVLICPPYTALQSISNIVSNSKVLLGSQNCHNQPSGAFTGEISIAMLQDLGCSYIIVGHSERRQFFGETDNSINEKLMAIFNSNLNAIMCIGETLNDRQSGKTFEVLEGQLRRGLNNISALEIGKLVIAYEPVWAIGTGVSAEIHQVQEAHSYIRNLLIELYGEIAKGIIIQYGGSVNDMNALNILELEDVNGALIGGASLKSESFLSIINIAEEIVST